MQRSHKLPLIVNWKITIKNKKKKISTFSYDSQKRCILLKHFYILNNVIIYDVKKISPLLSVVYKCLKIYGCVLEETNVMKESVWLLNSEIISSHFVQMPWLKMRPQKENAKEDHSSLKPHSWSRHSVSPIKLDDIWIM